MFSQPRSRAEQQIYQKRVTDQKMSNLQTKLKQQFHENEFAKWQNKGKNIQVANQVRGQIEQMRRQSQANLNARRQQLSQMLEFEAQGYQEEIVAMQETPEQTRMRMAERVKHLKEEKEDRRKADVNAKLDRRFQQNADELRKVDQEMKQLKVALERNIQMGERHGRMQNQYQEEMLFAELNRRDQLKRDELERLKRVEHKEKNQERNAILAIQKQLRQKKIQQEKQMTQYEKQMLKEEWERQSELEKLKERQQIEKAHVINRDLIEENQRQRIMREQQIRLERLRDREMIERIVEKERQLANYEKWMKENEREEARKTLKGVRSKGVEMVAYEQQLDRLIELERLKKEKKEAETWAKREQARVNLLYDVYNDRQSKVKDHKNEKDQGLRQKGQDRLEVERRLKEYEAEQERMREQDYIQGKKQQGTLLKEIAAKEERRRLLIMELQKEEQETEAGRREYDRKINERRDKGKEQLDQFKKTNSLF